MEKEEIEKKMEKFEFLDEERRKKSQRVERCEKETASDFFGRGIFFDIAPMFVLVSIFLMIVLDKLIETGCFTKIVLDVALQQFGGFTPS